VQKSRRKFRRPKGERLYKKLFLIATEGTKTEPQYFSLFNDRQSIIRIKLIDGRKDTSPLKVLQRMKNYLNEEALIKSDEAWLVIDKDDWTEDQLQALYSWSMEKENYGFALSNPNFEYWLLLHFEDGHGLTSVRDLDIRLRRFLPHYDKGIISQKLTDVRINSAVERAQLRDNPPCTDWPRNFGVSTVYKLVRNIIQL
jgi:hypothetical protein